MSDPRDIIREFSTFCVLEDRNGRKVPVLRADRELERLIASLVNDAALRVNKDAWARYFLLVARQNDPQRRASLSSSAPSDCRLQDIIKRLVELAPEPNQDIQVVHLQIFARQNDTRVANFLNNPVSFSEKLLSAHLQKTCWYAAKEFYEKRIQFSNLRYQYPLEECLQIASLRAIAPINLLKNFNFEYRRTTIKSYAEQKLWGVISDTIRAQNLEAKTKSFSDDGLLKSLAKRELIEALKLTDQNLEITCYCLALQCYKEIYQPKQISQNQLSPPTREQLQQIASRYNQRRQEFNISESVSSDNIQAMLKTCVQVVRAYRRSDSFIGRLHDDSSYSITNPWDILIQNEETLLQKVEMEQVSSIITKAFAELPDVAQKTLKLWFGLELTQSDILLVLGQLLGLKKQYEVSRRIKQYKKPVIKALIQELSVKSPKIFQPKNMTDKIISQMQEPIDDYLTQYCKNLLYPVLKNRLGLFSHNEKLLLSLHCRQHLQEQQIASQLQIPASELNTEILKLKQFLQAILKQWVEKTLDVNFMLCNSAEQKIAIFVNEWLQNNAVLED